MLRRTLARSMVIGAAAVSLAGLALAHGAGPRALARATLAVEGLGFESAIEAPEGDAQWARTGLDGAAGCFREGHSALPPARLVAHFAGQLEAQGYLRLRPGMRPGPRAARAVAGRGAYVLHLGPAVAALGYVHPDGRSAAAVAYPGPGGRGSRYLIGGLDRAADAGDDPVPGVAGLPLPEDARRTAALGRGDAALECVEVAGTPEAVRSHYRRALAARGWRPVSEAGPGLAFERAGRACQIWVEPEVPGRVAVTVLATGR